MVNRQRSFKKRKSSIEFEKFRGELLEVNCERLLWHAIVYVLLTFVCRVRRENHIEYFEQFLDHSMIRLKTAINE